MENCNTSQKIFFLLSEDFAFLHFLPRPHPVERPYAEGILTVVFSEKSFMIRYISKMESHPGQAHVFGITSKPAGDRANYFIFHIQIIIFALSFCQEKYHVGGFR